MKFAQGWWSVAILSLVTVAGIVNATNILASFATSSFKYTVLDAYINETDARNQCAALGGRLAVLDDATSRAELVAGLKANAVDLYSAFWIGRWYQNDPGVKCQAALADQSSLRLRPKPDCYLQLGVICQFANWLNYFFCQGTKCYSVLSNGFGYNGFEAYEACNRCGGHVADVGSTTEGEYLASQLSAYGTKWAWINSWHGDDYVDACLVLAPRPNNSFAITRPPDTTGSLSGCSELAPVICEDVRDVDGDGIPDCNDANSTNVAGTDFWFAFMEKIPDSDKYPSSLRVVINGAQNTSGVIEFNNTVIFFNIEASGVFEYDLPKEFYIKFIGTKRVGIHINADAPVTVEAYSLQATSEDSAMIFPTTALGSEYYISAPYSTYLWEEFAIVSPQDNTSVEIVLPSAERLYVDLNQSDVYQVQGENLTGTYIRVINDCEIKKIAVFSGSICWGYDCTFCDHLYEQEVPLYAYGKSYTIVPFYTTNFQDARSIVVVVAAQDNTLVNVSLTAYVLAKAGDHIKVDVAGIAKVVANKPIEVTQLPLICDATGDNAQISVIPDEQFINSADFTPMATPASPFNEAWLTIVAKVNDLIAEPIYLDGVAIDMAQYQFTFDPYFVYARLPVTNARHVVTSASKFAAYLFGSSFYANYGHLLNRDFRLLNPTICSPAKF